VQKTQDIPRRRVAPAGSMTTVVPGAILGSIVMPDHITSNAAKLSEEFFTAAEKEEFSGESVETYAIPIWAKRGGTAWLPDVSDLGYRRSNIPHELVVTAGVDPHTDGGGFVLMVVLHNDGLIFSQDGVRHAPCAGDWFIFDDHRSHKMKEARGRATFVGWHIPLVPA